MIRIEIFSIWLGWVVSLAYVVIGARLLRVHLPSGLAFIAAGGLLSASHCFGWLSHWAITSRDVDIVWAARAFTSTIVGFLLLVALVRMARRIDELRGPAKF
jgi:hypothetical protein